ncbi:hypothetical protein CDAR_546061 [Caerostris darwini]|uniref:Uncharacterized protein n=1 Tax=Caerostris darwini TaxID=1538125 RepID=A0AAV4X7F4_9ARAC|nr:hypothetical protein CDAR_546061 [Caerostris darwini]
MKERMLKWHSQKRSPLQSSVTPVSSSDVKLLIKLNHTVYFKAKHPYFKAENKRCLRKLRTLNKRILLLLIAESIRECSVSLIPAKSVWPMRMKEQMLKWHSQKRSPLQSSVAPVSPSDVKQLIKHRHLLQKIKKAIRK